MTHLQFVALAYLLSAVILAAYTAWLLLSKKRLDRKLRALEQRLAAAAPQQRQTPPHSEQAQ